MKSSFYEFFDFVRNRFIFGFASYSVVCYIEAKTIIHLNVGELSTTIIINIRGKLKTALLKTRALRAANDSKRAVNALTALQLIGSRFIIR